MAYQKKSLLLAITHEGEKTFSLFFLFLQKGNAPLPRNIHQLDESTSGNFMCSLSIRLAIK